MDGLEVACLGEPFQAARRDRAAQHDRPAGLADVHRDPQPGALVRPIVVLGLGPDVAPEDVHLQNDDGLQARRQDLAHRRLAGAAGPGDHEQRQAPERVPVTAARADGVGSISFDWLYWPQAQQTLNTS